MNASADTPRLPTPEEARSTLIDWGQLFYQRRWCDAGSGSFSVVIQRNPLQLLFTIPNRDKRRLQDGDFCVIDAQGQTEPSNPNLAISEAPIHGVIAEYLPHVQYIVHTQSVWSSLISESQFPQNNLVLEGFEMLKGLSGITNHTAKVHLKIYDNTQQIGELTRRLRLVFPEATPALRYGFILKRHGLFTWGKDAEEARRHLETLEYMFELLLQRSLFFPDAAKGFV